jgi:hypothetical protein
MIDFTEIADGEAWELFARDFLSELGFPETAPIAVLMLEKVYWFGPRKRKYPGLPNL